MENVRNAIKHTRRKTFTEVQKIKTSLKKQESDSKNVCVGMKSNAWFV